MPESSNTSWRHCVFAVVFLLCRITGARADDAPSAPLDPAAWGEDHAGKELPEYVTGDECLFCHRNVIGPTWAVNRHARTVRFKVNGEPPVNEVAELEKNSALKDFVGQIELVLGRKNKVRFLRTGKGYGHLELANVEMRPGATDQSAKFAHTDHPEWDDGKTFADKCAGCHATAVETESRGFAAFSLDCYACHGSITLNHTNDTSLMLLSKKREDPARVIASACGQCHLRGGKSKSTGLPYPNQFIAGDNLFKDYEADFSDVHIAQLNPADRHIYRNIRDIVLKGEEGLTCLNCHQVHENSSVKHKGVKKSEICLDCHLPEGPKKKLVEYEVHSEACGY